MSLLGFILCSFYEELLPKPGNIFIFLALMMSFVLGCYFSVPALVPDTEETAVDADGIGGSLTQRIVGSGWTWFAVYAVAIGLMVILYVF